MKKLLYKIKAFYVKDFLFLQDLKRKKFKMAVAMIIIENLQMLSIYTNNLNNNQYDQFPNYVQSFIKYFRIYSILGNSITTRIICVIVVFSLKTLFLSWLLYLVLGQDLFLRKKQTLQNLPLEQNNSNYQFENCWQSTLISCYCLSCNRIQDQTMLNLQFNFIQINY